MAVYWISKIDGKLQEEPADAESEQRNQCAACRGSPQRPAGIRLPNPAFIDVHIL